jgi:hypothetical protein
VFVSASFPYPCSYMYILVVTCACTSAHACSPRRAPLPVALRWRGRLGHNSKDTRPPLPLHAAPPRGAAGASGATGMAVAGHTSYAHKLQHSPGPGPGARTAVVINGNGAASAPAPPAAAYLPPPAPALVHSRSREMLKEEETEWRLQAAAAAAEMYRAFAAAPSQRLHRVYNSEKVRPHPSPDHPLMLRGSHTHTPHPS